jgi:aldose 1-epimerase
VADRSYFGALIGRYANRIGRARFALDGEEYRLPANDGPNHLHGGPLGFHKVVWQVEPFARGTDVGAVLGYLSRDGEEGYPGSLRASVTYTLTADATLVLDYEATTDRATPVNLTQHTYLALGGLDGGDGCDILDHELLLPASRYTPVDAGLIPTGELRPVAGSAFDFRAARAIGARIGDADEQLARGKGYDHNFVLDRERDGLALAARLRDPCSGRTLEISTTEPGVQFYSGNYLGDGAPGKGGRVYGYRTALALETQHFPDSPNEPAFPSTILRPGERFSSRTVYRFGVDGSAAAG